MRPQPLIAVSDVAASSVWYQKLLGCRSDHGGDEYERLRVGDSLILQLHKFDVAHHHGLIGDPNIKPYGNGVLLWFEVDNFEAVMGRIEKLNPEIVNPRHRNPDANHWEIWVRDLDGYIVVVASPEGSAGA